MRDIILNDWLSTTEWSAWTRHPVTGDASARRYERLSGPNDQRVILMDAPPETCGSQKPFVEMASHLVKINLAAPEVFAWDESLGILVLSDLGPTDFAKHLTASPLDEPHLYANAVDVLRILHKTPPPDGLVKMTPDIGTGMLDLAFEWAADEPSMDLRAAIETELHHLLTRIDPTPTALSLRDFHAENLIWRGDQNGTNRVGLLDFQDAFVTHPTYDLASLLRDARRDVVTEMLDELLYRLDPDADQDDHRTAFHVMAVQRNLRILGIFRRLAVRDGKTRYLDFIPRVENHIRTDLNAPELATLSQLVSRAFLKGLN